MGIVGHRLWSGAVSHGIVPCDPAGGGWEYADRSQSVLEDLTRHARSHGNRECLVDGVSHLGFAQVEAMTTTLAAALSRRYGIRKGEPVALLMAYSWQFALSVVALFKLGAIVLALNTKLHTQELVFMLKDSGSSVLVVDPEGGPMWNRCVATCRLSTSSRCSQ